MNTQTQEALKMAIEALEIMAQTYPYSPPCLDWEDKVYAHRKNKEAIQACKEALEQEDELMSVIVSLQKHIKELKFAGAKIEQPAHEPVAWIYTKRGDWGYTDDSIEASTSKVVATIGKIEPTPLYTHPAPSWKGLSDDEIRATMKFLWNSEPDFDEHDWYEFQEVARAIEQALRNKNE